MPERPVVVVVAAVVATEPLFARVRWSGRRLADARTSGAARALAVRRLPPPPASVHAHAATRSVLLTGRKEEEEDGDDDDDEEEAGGEE